MLRRRFQVHPDRNRHPEATAAFQRIAAASQVLSDPQSRAGYDNDLRANVQRDPFSKSEPESRPQPTAEEAFASFAFATAAVGSGSGGLVGDMAEVTPSVGTSLPRHCVLFATAVPRCLVLCLTIY